MCFEVFGGDLEPEGTGTPFLLRFFYVWKDVQVHLDHPLHPTGGSAADPH
jgi:hypothetical protein